MEAQQIDVKKRTTPIARRIEAIVEEVPGWTPIDQLLALFGLVYSSAHLPGDIIEVGSWCGRSGAVLGLAAQLIGNTKVHCIDLFPRKTDWFRNSQGTYSLSVEVDGQKIAAYDAQTVWAEAYERDIVPIYKKHDDVFDIFRETMQRNSLEDIVSPYRGTLSMFSKGVGAELSYKLAFIDGDHGYQAVCADIRNVERHLVRGGWICFDDAFSGYEGIDRAITDLVLNSDTYEYGQQLTRKLFVARKKAE